MMSSRFDPGSTSARPYIAPPQPPTQTPTTTTATATYPNPHPKSQEIEICWVRRIDGEDRREKGKERETRSLKVEREGGESECELEKREKWEQKRLK